MVAINPYALVVASIPLLYITWIKTHQVEAVSLLAELKRRYRRWIIRRHGEAAANQLEKQVRTKAGDNPLAQKAIDIVMRQERERLVEKFGTRYANTSLGPPDVIERDF